MFKFGTALRICYAKSRRELLQCQLRTFATALSKNKILTNKLQSARSPYLQSQSASMVAWQEWNPETLELAKILNRPIFLSIGYSSSHWCHVMAHESWNTPDISQFINENFVPIMVDREERPDVDSVYTMYMQVTKGASGWPLNVFLDPKSRAPFYGGLFWDSNQFKDIMSGVGNVWNSNNLACIESAKTVKKKLENLLSEQSGAEYQSKGLQLQALDDLKKHYNNKFDATYGGFSEAPKFPTPHNLSFLLKYSELLKTEGENEKDSMKDKALFTLRKIGQSALRDHLGRGFFRYSMTVDWSLPHFEKLLIDQAGLLSVYTQAYQVATDPKDKDEFLDIIKDLVEYISLELQDPTTGGFFSSEDSDSIPSKSILPKSEESGKYEKVEGAYYLWQSDDFARPLTRIENDIMASYFNVEDLGNISSEFDTDHTIPLQNTLYVNKTFKEVGQMFGKNELKVKEIVSSGKSKLSQYRNETREKPSVDKKIITGWNGLAIGSLAQASQVVGNSNPELSSLALKSAIKCADFIYENMYDSNQGNLYRIYSEGAPGKALAVNEDYAYYISGLLDLYNASLDTKYLDLARQLQEIQLVYFWDFNNGGFFTVSEALSSEQGLYLRPKSSFDGAEPSSNGISVSNLTRLSSLLNDAYFADQANALLHCFGRELLAQAYSYTSMLGSLIIQTNGITSVLIVGHENEQTKKDLKNLMCSQLCTDVTLTRITEQNVSQYFDNYGTSIFSDLQKNYGSGPLTFFIYRNYSPVHECTSVSELEMLLNKYKNL